MCTGPKRSFTIQNTIPCHYNYCSLVRTRRAHDQQRIDLQRQWWSTHRYHCWPTRILVSDYDCLSVFLNYALSLYIYIYSRLRRSLSRKHCQPLDHRTQRLRISIITRSMQSQVCVRCAVSRAHPIHSYCSPTMNIYAVSVQFCLRLHVLLRCATLVGLHGDPRRSVDINF